MDTATSPTYSPSCCHQHQLSQIVPELAYDGSDVKAWQQKLRTKLQDLIGMPSREGLPDLNPRQLWQRDTEFGSIEKIVFTSEAQCDVPAYVCLPANAQPPYTFMVCLQGHSSGMHNSIAVQKDNEELPLTIEGDRDFAIGCMKRGIAAICIEQRSFGERSEQLQQDAKPFCHEAATHAMMLGRTLIGERVFDVDRAIDYLVTRNDCDPQRIGVMGNSGGGTVSMFSSALLPRIQFAIPSCYFNSFKASVMSIHHCTCNYIPSIVKYAEMSDIMGLFAPKPLVIVAGAQDEIFPIDATKAQFEKLKKIYAAAGAEDKCHLVIGPEGHRFYADIAWSPMLEELRQL